MTNIPAPRWITAVTVVALLATGTPAALAAGSESRSTAVATSAPAVAPLTNLAHLDFLLDTTTPPPTEGHTTYRIDSEPTLTMPWTYADARDGGTFERVGGGPLDPATGYWGQGAFNADDITRAAVVYIRHWQQTGAESSRTTAYELLRSTAYLQTATGDNAGNVVLWMQPDGTLNPSPEPVELPDPSDSGDSYWLARTLWAFGEGYAAFRKADPEFARFLQERLRLGVKALERQVLVDYGEYRIADGKKVPAWLIVDGADASAEAVLGLAAYSSAAPRDVRIRVVLSRLAEGIARLGTGDPRQWPYGAILPWAQSRSMWHAWASQMPAALAAASVTLKNNRLLKPAIADSVGFTPTLLTAGGPDNGWFPTPSERVQIAYGVDSRLQSLLAVADAARRPGLDQLAGIEASWYFGTNGSGEAIYNPATGVTYDGVQADGSINRNSGAESTIHGLLSMLALDANPDVSSRAQALTSVIDRTGLEVVEAENATSTTGTVVTPESAWTGESLYGGGAFLRLEVGQTAQIPVPGSGERNVEPSTFQPGTGFTRSRWSAGERPLGSLKHGVGEQGITAIPGAMLPQTLRRTIDSATDTVSVTAERGTVDIDAILVRPLVSRLLFGGPTATTEMVHSTSSSRERTTVGSAGARSTVRSYDSDGRLVHEQNIRGERELTLRAGGFAVISSR